MVTAMILCVSAVPGTAQQPAAAPAGKPDHVAAVKASLQNGMAALRQYEWTETTAVSLKGEEKSRTQNSCRYGPDGTVLKTPLTAPTEQKKSPRGVRGKIVENKKEDISEAVKEAVALVKQYVPPDAARIQAAKEAGKLTMTPPDAKGMVRVVIKDYLKPGDSITLDLNVATDQLAAMMVSTFTDSAKDAVTLRVGFAAFPDGSVFSGTTHLEVASQKLSVDITNSGHKKLGT
jgi:hypothetical protein